MWHARPLADGDIDDVVAMVNACRRADGHEQMLHSADLFAELQVAGVDRERDAVVLISAGRIVAWGLVQHARRPRSDVHPDVRGQGIETWLGRWSEYRARATGGGPEGQG